MTGPGRPVSRRIVLSGVAAAALSDAGCTGPTESATSPAPFGSASPPTPTAPATPTSGSAPAAGSATSAPLPDGVALGDPGPDITKGPAGRPWVALTFHGAGDPALTTQALQILSAASAGVTVFAVGQWLDAQPRLGRAIVDAGNDLGNHTWSHQDMLRLSPAQAVDEIRRGADAVARAIGRAGLLFRPSGTPSSTATIRSAAAASGYQRCVSYSVDPADYTDPGAELVRTRTLASIGPGDIVSLHLGHPGTVAALSGILSGLASRGLSSVPLTRLLTPA